MFGSEKKRDLLQCESVGRTWWKYHNTCIPLILGHLILIHRNGEITNQSTMQSPPPYIVVLNELWLIKVIQ